MCRLEARTLQHTEADSSRRKRIQVARLTPHTLRPLSYKRHETSAMRPTQQEFANPREWLTELAEESDGYRRLVRESGGAGRAAYRLARARCSAAHGGEPCLEDLQAAAQLLATKLGSGGSLPIKSLLPSARSVAPVAKAAALPVKAAGPTAKSGAPAAPVAKSAAPAAISAPPAPSSAERHAASKSRARKSTPTLSVDS